MHYGFSPLVIWTLRNFDSGSHFLKPELFQMKMFFPFLTLPLCCDFWLAKVLGQVSPLCMTACLSIVPLSMSMSMTEYTLSDPYLGKTDDVFVGHVDVGVFSWLNNSINNVQKSGICWLGNYSPSPKLFRKFICFDRVRLPPGLI